MSVLLDRAMGAPLLLARRRRPRTGCDNPRILVVRRNRMGDMICTLPLLRALRAHFPAARITVACDVAGEPVARACTVVDKVILLNSTWTRRLPPIFNAARLQNHDWVIVAKGGFDRRLARLARLTHAAVRIGFEPHGRGVSDYFTHPVALPSNPAGEHQIETLLRLLAPLDIAPPPFDPAMLRLRLSGAALHFARTVLAAGPFAQAPGFALLNVSCNRPVQFSCEDYAAVIRHLVETTKLAVAIVGAPLDRAVVEGLARRFSSGRVAPIATPGPLDLAALLERAVIFLTPEGGAAHLSSSTQTPTVVLWHGHYGKWRPRGPQHILVEAASDLASIPLAGVLDAVDSLLASTKG